MTIPHGYVKHVLEDCWCDRCRGSDDLRKKILLGYAQLPVEVVDPNTQVAENLRDLYAAGLTWAQVSEVTNLMPGQIDALLQNRAGELKDYVVRRALSVDPKSVYDPDLETGFYPGSYAWALIEGLEGAGFTRAQIAQKILSTRQIELGKQRVIARKVMPLQRAYRKYVGDHAQLLEKHGGVSSD